jgi:hypothetical protein
MPLGKHRHISGPRHVIVGSERVTVGWAPPKALFGSIPRCGGRGC